jgi:hypothetical protein
MDTTELRNGAVGAQFVGELVGTLDEEVSGLSRVIEHHDPIGFKRTLASDLEIADVVLAQQGRMWVSTSSCVSSYSSPVCAETTTRSSRLHGRVEGSRSQRTSSAIPRPCRRTGWYAWLSSGRTGTREFSSLVVGDLGIVEVPVLLHGWEAMPSGPGSDAKLTGEATGNSRALAG